MGVPVSPEFSWHSGDWVSSEVYCVFGSRALLLSSGRDRRLLAGTEHSTGVTRSVPGCYEPLGGLSSFFYPMVGCTD